MFDSRYSNFLTVLLIIIIIAVFALLGYLGYDYYQKYYITKSSSDFVDAFPDVIGSTENEENKEENKEENNTEEQNVVIDNSVFEQIEGVSKGNATSTTKKVQYNGFDVLGTIEIPKTGIKYPILSEETKKSLETAVVVRYPTNATLNTVGNVVIAGHNYRNGVFFSNNKKLSIGDKIYITDLTGTKLTYVIYNKFEAESEDTTFYNRDTQGAKEITLTTCTDDSNSNARTIIFAKVQ